MIIGIDPSLVGTAYCLLEFDGTIIKGNIEPKKLRGVERLLYIRGVLDSILHSSQIDLCCLEGYAFCRPNQAHQIGELGGVIRILLHELEIPHIEIAPPSLKKFATGKGSAKKDQVVLNVYKRWGVECNNDNEADAYVLARMGRAILVGEELTQAQAEALEKPRRAFELLCCEKEELNV